MEGQMSYAKPHRVTPSGIKVISSVIYKEKYGPGYERNPRYIALSESHRISDTKNYEDGSVEFVFVPKVSASSNLENIVNKPMPKPIAQLTSDPDAIEFTENNWNYRISHMPEGLAYAVRSIYTLAHSQIDSFNSFVKKKFTIGSKALKTAYGKIHQQKPSEQLDNNSWYENFPYLKKLQIRGIQDFPTYQRLKMRFNHNIRHSYKTR